MKVGDIVLLKPADIFHRSEDGEFRKRVEEALFNELGTGLIVQFDETWNEVNSYWSKSGESTWEHTEDLEVLNE